jgi:hypothetical protein
MTLSGTGGCEFCSDAAGLNPRSLTAPPPVCGRLNPSQKSGSPTTASSSVDSSEAIPGSAEP